MEQLIHCIYASTATPAFEEQEIPAILARSRDNNARCGITGMLLFIEGSFFQILEGHAAAVADIYKVIERDPRHSRVTQIIREPIPRRTFGEWTMGFSAISLQDLGNVAGENDFFRDANCVERLNSGRAKRLLATFAEGQWRTDRTGRFAAPGRAV